MEYSYIWLTAIIVLCIAEAATAQLVSIWFVLGAVVSLILSFFVDSLAIQIGVFIIISLILLLITRPLLKGVLHFKKEETNAGRYIGKKAFVLSDINNDLGVGQINVNGVVWGAKSSDGKVIKAGESVVVNSIEGVKCVVSLV